MNTKPAKLSYAQLGTVKTGAINTGWTGTKIAYTINDHHSGITHVKVDPATAKVRLETAEEASKHLSGGRVGGGLVAGAVLLGPLGAVIGGGLGAAARKSYSDKYIIVEDGDGNAYTARLRNRRDFVNAEKLVEGVARVQADAA